jgi:hypothetical protein
MSGLQLVQCDGDAARRCVGENCTLALWDTSVTAENGPMGRSDFEYYDSRPVRQDIPIPQLRH